MKRRITLALAAVTAVVFALLSAQAANAAGVTATFTKVSDWGSGFQAQINMTNTTVTAGTALHVYVGGTVSPAAAQPAGVYSGDVTLSVVYF